jgi:hypothetical protein
VLYTFNKSFSVISRAGNAPIPALFTKVSIFPSNKASASLAFCGIDFKSLMSNDNGIAPISSATFFSFFHLSL